MSKLYCQLKLFFVCFRLKVRIPVVDGECFVAQVPEQRYKVSQKSEIRVFSGAAHFPPRLLYMYLRTLPGLSTLEEHLGETLAKVKSICQMIDNVSRSWVGGTWALKLTRTQTNPSTRATQLAKSVGTVKRRSEVRILRWRVFSKICTWRWFFLLEKYLLKIFESISCYSKKIWENILKFRPNLQLQFNHFNGLFTAACLRHVFRFVLDC